MQDKITSHNQSGGITAKVVNQNLEQPSNTTNSSPIKKSKWRVWGFMAGGIAFVASAVKILEYLNVKPW